MEGVKRKYGEKAISFMDGGTYKHIQIYQVVEFVDGEEKEIPITHTCYKEKSGTPWQQHFVYKDKKYSTWKEVRTVYETENPVQEVSNATI